MTRSQYLEDQALRAERLAKVILDSFTTTRLRDYASSCRAELTGIITARPGTKAAEEREGGS